MKEEVIRFDGEGSAIMKILAAVLCLSSLGGFVHWLRYKGGHTIFTLILSLFTSAFVGLQAHFFMRYLGLSQDLQFAMAGVCGYSAGALLDIITPLLIRIVYKRCGIEYPMPRRRAEDQVE